MRPYWIEEMKESTCMYICMFWLHDGMPQALTVQVA